ncbi:MAG: DNA polymerase IV [Clostridiaceae bacterium]|nr:DNA polymerase IV [Clostridiaceae bacterium]
MNQDRTILHCDMNAYYASVEIKLNPSLRGKPVAVAGSQADRNGIILAKSEEAKQQGVKTGEVIWQAKQKCPNLITVPPQYDQYILHSKLAHKIYYDYTDQIEPFGLDECWLDVTASKALFGGGIQIAKLISQRVKKELQLTLSIGISFNKVFAKLGSDMNKPDAITYVSQENYTDLVFKLPARSLLGVGSATERKLTKYNILTIGDLARTDPAFLQSKLGINGVKLWSWANGLDNGRVRVYGESIPVKTVGHGITTTEDLYTDIEVWRVLLALSENVSKRLRSHSLRARGVQISVRRNDMSGTEFQAPLPYATYNSFYISQNGFMLFKERYDWKKPIRSLTIRAINLESSNIPRQINLFSDFSKLAKLEDLEDVMFSLHQRYGAKIVYPARLMEDIKIAKQVPYDIKPPGLPVFQS